MTSEKRNERRRTQRLSQLKKYLLDWREELRLKDATLSTGSTEWLDNTIQKLESDPSELLDTLMGLDGQRNTTCIAPAPINRPKPNRRKSSG